MKRNPGEIARNVKTIIVNKGTTQREVAKIIGCDEKKLSAMLCGRALITAKDIVPLCLALDVTPNDLLGFANKPA